MCSVAAMSQVTIDTTRIREGSIIPEDTSKPRPKVIDTTIKKHSPRIAAIRSAIVPGLGQIYNKKYWKLPIVYGALGVTGYIFFDNLKTYREYRFAYSARFKAAVTGATAADSVDYFKLKPQYKLYPPESIRSARNQFRKYIDYSVLIFVLMWGLNVVDATVDAHLMSFDVSPDISFRFKPGRSELARTNGLSMVFMLQDKKRELPTFR